MSTQLKAALASFRKIVNSPSTVFLAGNTLEDTANLKWFDEQIRNMTPGALDVTIERSRQIEIGYGRDHDDKLTNRELIFAAFDRLGVTEISGKSQVNLTEGFPSPTLENLKVAAALLIAEIDRLKHIQLAEELALAS